MFQDINTWFKVNLLTLNFNKTKYVEFRSNNYYFFNIKIKSDQECITNAPEIKFLGLTLWRLSFFKFFAHPVFKM
jgi:hypothetical protein